VENLTELWSMRSFPFGCAQGQDANLISMTI
jgi:hypothetical protein